MQFLKKSIAVMLTVILSITVFSGTVVFAAAPTLSGYNVKAATDPAYSTVLGKSIVKTYGGQASNVYTYGASGFTANFIGTEFWMYVPELPEWEGYKKQEIMVLVDTDMPMEATKYVISEPGWVKIASDLEENVPHTIKMYKQSRGFYGFMASEWLVVSHIATDGEYLTPNPVSDLVIEVYGDSITNGDAVWLNGDGSNSSYTYGSYAGVVSRLLGAELRATGNTGNGLKGWVLATPGNGEVENLLPPQNCWDKFDSQCYGEISWSHEGANAADVVIINLGTNDRLELGGGDLTDTAFEDEYIRFIKQIKTDCPDAIVICTVGAMGLLKGDNYEVDFERITSEANSWANEEFAFFTELANCGTITNGVGYDGGHPSNTAHEVYGLQIATLINEKLNLGVDLEKLPAEETRHNINLEQTYLSSTDYNSEHSKNAAFDGNKSTSWQAAQNTANGAFLQVTYDKEYEIKDVVVLFEEFYPTGTTKIEYSLDGRTWYEFKYFTATSVTEYSFSVETPVKARHLKITYSGTSDGKGYPAKIAEFKAYEEAEEEKKTVAAITKQPQDVYGGIGETVRVEFSAEGDGLTYEWYFKNAKGTNFYKASITGDCYEIEMNADRAGRQVYCVITDKYGNSVKTDTVTIDLPANTIVITKQPQDAYAAVGAIATTTVTATGEGLTYQWYVKNPTGSKFNKSSITAATYSFTMSSTFNGRQVYCVITDKNGNSVQTETVTLSVPASTVVITKQPQNAYAAVGTIATTTVTATGEGLTYQWYVKNPHGTKFNKSSITAATYSFTMSSTFDGRQVYCVITDKNGNSVQTETVTLSVPVNTIVITEQPQNASAKNGAKVMTTVTATGEELTYQWYVKNPHGTKFNKSSITTATYSCTMLEGYNGRQVYCVITDKYGNTVTTEIVTLSMN